MIEFNFVALRQAIRTLAAGLFAIVMAHYFLSPATYWMILSACLLAQVRIGDLFYQHIVSQLAVGMLAAIGVFFASWWGKNLLFLSMFLAITSFVSVYVGFRWKNLFFAAYVVNLLAMMGGGMPVDLQAAAVRRQYIICGMLIAMGTTFSCWPNYFRFAVKTTVQNCRNICKKTLATAFSIYLMHDYLPQYFVYEKKIYQLSREFFYWIDVLSRLSERKKNKKIPVRKLIYTFQIIMALGLLRYRVKDHTTFEVIDQELKNVLSALDDSFNKPYFPNDLDESIDRLEEVYRSALQVVAQEPLIFLFFIQDLRALAKELK
jgi:hypothetical protein